MYETNVFDIILIYLFFAAHKGLNNEDKGIKSIASNQHITGS